MIIRIDNTGFQNKGAELMLHAVLQRARATLPEARFVFGLGAQNRERIRGLGLGRLSDDKIAGVRLRHILPAALLNRFGQFSPKQADLVLDATGYGYGDPWITPLVTSKRNQKLADHYRRLRVAGARVVLLPQALGPFETELAAERFRLVAEHADLIYAREEISLRHARSVIGDISKLRCASDFTALCVPGVEAAAFVRPGAFVVIPNVRMTTHSSAEVAAGYEPFMARVARGFVEAGKKVVVLNHGGVEDAPLCRRIAGAAGAEFVDPPDALAVKAVIGGAEAVVSSRFHGVISALAQGVPVYCTSWSHKYPMAYKDFGMESRILSVDTSSAPPLGLDELLDDARRAIFRAELKSGGVLVKARIQAMWEEVLGPSPA
jgi:colanic acid/amylovoran biosynthesis protein